MPASAGRRDGMLVRNCQLSRPVAVEDDVDEQRRQRRERQREHDDGHRLNEQVTRMPDGPAPGRGGADGAHAYSSRYRRRSQLLMKFSANVIRKSSMPTAKIVRYSSVPAGVSPRLTWTM